MPKRKQIKNLPHQSAPSQFRMWKKQRISSLSEADKEELSTLFGKKFKYSSIIETPDDKVESTPSLEKTSAILQVEDFLSLDDNNLLNWKDGDLMALKREMNDLKNQLSNKDIVLWHSHTTACNLAGKIIPYVKTLHVELCTQAWVKFYEMLSAFKIVPDTSFLSVHLCEAPGAFIAALNHHLQLHAFPYSWDWRATTLNPYYEANSTQEMIADDRLFRHTYSQCYFGSDGSGDIRAKNHISGLHSMVKELERRGREAKVLLVTADGSRDCQENPAEQESLLSQLHYCEMIAACLILSPGGNFVLKIFTMFESSTISLLFLLNIMFKEVHAFKPATSKGGNSETYLICLNYRNNVTEETLFKMLTAVLDNNITCFIRQSQIPKDFMEAHRISCKNFAHWQATTIQRNMRLFDLESHQARRQVQDLQEAVVDMFIEKTHISYSRDFKKLVFNIREASSFTVIKSEILRGGNRSHHASSYLAHHKGLRGTFHLRQNLSSLPFHERLALMSLKDDSQPDMALTSRFPLEDDELNDLLVMEKAQCFNAINNSQLCEAELLNDLNMMLQHSEYLKHRDETKSNDTSCLADMLVSIVTKLRDNGKHHQDFFRRDNRAASKSIPFRRHKSSTSEDVDQQSLSPEWGRHQQAAAWSCSLSTSPTKTTPFLGNKTMNSAADQSDHHDDSSSPPTTSARQEENSLFWVIEEEQERHSRLYQMFNDAMSTHSFPISIVNLKIDAVGPPKLLHNANNVFMNLSFFSRECELNDVKAGHMEILTKRMCINKIVWALQNVPLGCNLVFLKDTILTRFSAGLVYILARCFRQVRIHARPSLWLHQLFVMEDFQGAHDAVLKHLKDVKDALEEEDKDGKKTDTIVEIISFRHILNDRKFVQMVTSHNNFLLASFINTILKQHNHG